MLRLFSNIYFGVTLLTLTLIYASVFSALPQLRGALELTEMDAFSHWLFTTLCVLLAIAVTVVTMRRIRWSVPNLGVLTVHSGILIMIAGSILYFGTKVEGDVLLQSPRVELLSTSGNRQTIAKLLAWSGESWRETMPAFGGPVEVEVLDRTVESGGTRAAQVRVRSGTDEQTVSLVANGEESAVAGGRLALRLVSPEAERIFYDRERAALLFRETGTRAWRFEELVGLPYYRERYTHDADSMLEDTAGRPAPSKRTRPEVALGALRIPTGWFEHWTLPIAVESEHLPFDVSVTGFLPYVAGMRRGAADGGSVLNPVVELRLKIRGNPQELSRTMFALDPVESLLQSTPPIEFRWLRSEEERRAVLTPLLATDELVVQVKDPPVEKRYAVVAGQMIDVEGTSYTLTVDQLMNDWPLVSPGFEGAVSPAALIAVKGPETSFTRTVIQRFPQMSQDIDSAGMRRREGFVDDNIVLSYRNVSRGAILLLADEASAARGEATLAVFRPDGQVEHGTIQPGLRTRVPVGGSELELTMETLRSHARRVDMPVIEPLESRRPDLAMRSASVVRLEVSGRGEHAGWRETHWVPFSSYPEVDARPLFIKPPGVEKEYELVYGRVPHDLGALLTPGRLTVEFFPARESVESWRSEFLAQVDGEPSATPASVHTNHTYSLGNWTLFQSGAAQDHWSYTILGVGNRLGIWPMTLGCVLITLGSLYAFYVKPALLKRRAVTAVAGRQRRERELAEVAATN